MKRMDRAEYEALHEEIVSRVSAVYGLDNSVLVIIASIWAVVFAARPEFFNLNVADGQALVGFVRIFLLLVALEIIYNFALKNNENLHQILTLASYVKIFYEFPSQHCANQGDEDDDRVMAWETVQTLTNQFKDDAIVKARKIKTRINHSYLLLSIVTWLMLIFFCSFDFPKPWSIALAAIAVVLSWRYMLLIRKLIYTDIFDQEAAERIMLIFIDAAIAMDVIDLSNIKIDGSLKTANDMEMIRKWILSEVSGNGNRNRPSSPFKVEES